MRGLIERLAVPLLDLVFNGLDGRLARFAAGADFGLTFGFNPPVGGHPTEKPLDPALQFVECRGVTIRVSFGARGERLTLPAVHSADTAAAAAIISAIDSGEGGHGVGDRRQERSLVVAVWPLHVDQLAIIARSAVWAERRSTSVHSTTFQIASKNFAFSFWYWR